MKNLSNWGLALMVLGMITLGTGLALVSIPLALCYGGVALFASGWALVRLEMKKISRDRLKILEGGGKK